MNHTKITAIWLRQYLKEIGDFTTIEELKAFVWKKCKPYVSNKDSFVKGQRLVNYQKILEAIKQS